MIRRVVFRLVTILCMSYLFVCSATAQEKLDSLAEKVRPAVVAVTAYDSKGEVLRRATGFFIASDGRLLTCRQVLKGAWRAEARTSDGKTYPIKAVLAEERDFDLIQLRAALIDAEVPFLRMTEAPPVSSQVLFVIGPEHILPGTVSQVRELARAGRNFEFANFLTPDATGAPVINDKGDVIAIASSQIVEDQELTIAFSSGSVLAMHLEKPRPFDDRSVSVNAEPWTPTEALFFAGINQLFLEKYEKAMPILEEVVRRSADDAGARLHRGFARSRLGRYEEALQDYRETARLAPTSAEAFNNIAAMYIRLRRYPEALDAYMRLIQLKPDYPLGYNNLGAVYLNLGRYEEAIMALRKGIEYAPRSAETYLNLGAAYDMAGDHRQAIDALNKALKVRPRYAEAYNLLGGITAGQGRMQEADQYFKKAVEIKPDFPGARFNLGVTRLMLGDTDSAFEAHGVLKNLDQALAGRLYDLIERTYMVAAASGPESAGYHVGAPSAPQAAIVRLIDNIKGLAAKGTLRRDTADGLIAELQIANRQPDRDQSIIKINLLNHFVEKVSSLIKEQALPAEDGQRLIDATNMIINRVPG